MRDKIGSRQLESRIMSSQEAAQLIRNGMTVAFGGYTSSGYPKVIPGELVKRRQAGENLKIDLLSGANVGPEIDDHMGGAGLINRRAPLQASRILAKLINDRQVHYTEIPLHKMPRIVRNGVFGKIDIAVVEAIAITGEGYIVPSASVGMVPAFVSQADAVIVELNAAQPAELEGIHDIYCPALPPYRKPIPLTATNQKIGEPFIRVNPNKIKGIVASDIPDQAVSFTGDDEVTTKIADNLQNFLELEFRCRGMAKLPPIQSGMGNLANGLVRAFGNAKFANLEFYCGVLQEANIELIERGKVCAASAGAFSPTLKVLDFIRREAAAVKEIMVLRPTDLSNNAEIIDRLGLIALNSAVEIDIYGNANTSHVMGSGVVNGIGGGGAFAQNAYLSIMLLPSELRDGKVSTIVPMVTHNDINEHDVDVIITDRGVADLRGKDPVERATCIIGNCASLAYKEQLMYYLRNSLAKAGGHQPQLLEEAFSWHLRLKETGTMKVNG